ncbi:unnamed protein product [Peronospora destructor]|uniref:Uncharacterized protein n=1 Tax=Peronospora destructor TaxID=86335 RepID=A0AAV0V5W9_9STRA|nr:unnamed protein product [Peronospora destructor]
MATTRCSGPHRAQRVRHISPLLDADFGSGDTEECDDDSPSSGLTLVQDASSNGRVPSRDDDCVHRVRAILASGAPSTPTRCLTAKYLRQEHLSDMTYSQTDEYATALLARVNKERALMDCR